MERHRIWVAGSMAILVVLTYSAARATGFTDPRLDDLASSQSAAGQPAPTASPSITEAAIASQRAQWSATGITSYRYEVTLRCFCFFPEDQPVTMTVVDGQSTSMTWANGTPLSSSDSSFEQFRTLATIDGVFDELERLRTAADFVDAAFDPPLGFPNEIDVDSILQAVDDELFVLITKVEILQPDELPGMGGPP